MPISEDHNPPMETHRRVQGKFANFSSCELLPAPKSKDRKQKDLLIADGKNFPLVGSILPSLL